MTKHVTESARSNAIRITLNARPEIDPGTEPLAIEPVTIERVYDQYSRAYFDVQDDGSHSVDNLDWKQHDQASEAWEDFVNSKNYDCYGVGLLVGPGRSDVKTHELVAMPNHWRVMWIDGRDRIHHVGNFLHRLSALAVAKALDDADRCPLVITPYMCIDREWNSDFVVESSELNEAIRRALR